MHMGVTLGHSGISSTLDSRNRIGLGGGDEPSPSYSLSYCASFLLGLLW